MKVIYSKPREPAVIPTPIKKPNSTKSLDCGGMAFNNKAIVVIPAISYQVFEVNVYPLLPL